MKKTIITFWLLIITLGLWATGVPAGELKTTITLREEVVTSEDRIYLRDVADIEGESEVDNVVIGNSPWVGSSRKVSIGLIRMRLMAAGHQMDAFSFKGAENCVVRRAATQIEPEEIIQTARKHLRSQFSDDIEQLSITLINDCPPVMIEESTEDEITLRPSISSSGQNSTSTVDVEIIKDGRRLRQISLRFSVDIREKVAVAKNRIRPGSEFNDTNTKFKTRNVSGINTSPVTSAEALEGKVAARPISPDQVITKGALEKPEPQVVVERNQRVTLRYDNGGLKIDTVGEALHRARKGERVRVENLSSGKEIEGTAIGDGMVRIN